MTDLKKRINAVSDLLTLPDVVTKINTMVRDNRTSAADITLVISRDIALSAKVLRLVNSPFYGFNRRITSINYAIVILGFNAIRNLALSAFMFDLYRSRAEGFDSRSFWRFSISCAAVAQAIAAKLGFVKPEDAFMAGLLHDIGIVIMSQHFRDDFARIIRRCQEDDCSLLEAEAKELDYTHREVGALLLDRWNLPAEMIDAVREYAYVDENSGKISAIVHLAHVLTTALCQGTPGDGRILALSPLALASLGLNGDDIPSYAELALTAAEGVSEFMSLDKE